MNRLPKKKVKKSTTEVDAHLLGNQLLQNSQPHTSDTLVVVPLHDMPWSRPMRKPFAAILSMKPGEVLDCPKVAIHATRLDDGSYGFSDGVFTPEGPSQPLADGMLWPRLSELLRKEPREFRRFLHPKLGYKPYAAAKAWHQGDEDHDRSGGGDTPATALLIFANWSRWEGEEAKWDKRVLDLRDVAELDELQATLVGAQKLPDLRLDQLKSAAGKLLKFCKRLGLEGGDRADWGLHVELLLALLRPAEKLSEPASK